MVCPKTPVIPKVLGVNGLSQDTGDTVGAGFIPALTPRGIAGDTVGAGTDPGGVTP